MDELSEKLVKKIKETFWEQKKKVPELWRFYWGVRDGFATYEEASIFAVKLGEALSYSIRKNISADMLKDGVMTEELARAVLHSLLIENHEVISSALETMQNAINAELDIGVKAVHVNFNENRARGLIKKYGSYDNYSDAEWVVGEPIVNFFQAVVDKAVELNMEVQAKAGYFPTVTRFAESGCCKWCSSLEGTYAYPVDKEVYRRHERCRCLVLFVSGKKVQDVHTKKLYQAASQKERNDRIQKIGRYSISATEGRMNRISRVLDAETQL